MYCNYTIMKKLHLILGIFMFAQFGNAQQGDSYESLWEKVEKLETEDLSKSALNLIETISKKARLEKNETQIIKSLLYKSKFALILEEDAELNIVNDFKVEIAIAEGSTKNILHSYLANIYWQYFQQNRYTFYNRTTTETKVDNVDFRTWDLNTLFQEIDVHFQASLENPEVLQKLPISNFNVILNKVKESSEFRPTLFDLLANNALSFYTTSENSIQKPADAFEIDNTEVLCEAYSFSFLNADSTDANSLQSKALKIYQQLVSFHFGNADIRPLVLVDIERLLFIHQFATFANKDNLLIEVLQNSAESIKNSPLSGLYTFEIAYRYQQMGGTYNPKTNEEHQWKLKEAIALCDKVITKFPKSRSAKKCQALKSQIETPFIQLLTEKHIPTNTIGRLLVTYKSYENIQLTAYRISKKQLEELNELYPQAKKLTFLKNLSVQTTWNSTLKTENDFQTHSTEISMPALANIMPL